MTEFIEAFEALLSTSELSIFQNMNSPFQIQEFLDGLPYIAEVRDRSPLNVLLDRQCHCLDGGFFAALALWRLGHKPLLVDLVPNQDEDDDHVLALYQIDGRWGALAKSNYVNLGFREPVYRDVRELAMSYFEHYCSVKQTKTLRGYTRPFDASRFTHIDWAADETAANKLYYKHFYGRRAIPLISEQMACRLTPITDRVYKAETLFTDLSWSFGIRPEH